MRALEPGLLSFRRWLAGDAASGFAKALGAGGDWAYSR
jgi:hypothetical protein